MYNSDAKETEVDIMKSESHLGGELTAEVPKKDKKKKIEGSKEHSANKKKRTSKSSEPDGVKDETPKEEGGKVKKLKFSTRQDLAHMHFQIETPSTSVERNIFHGGSLLHGTPDRSRKEGVPNRLAKEGTREVMSTRYNANLEGTCHSNCQLWPSNVDFCKAFIAWSKPCKKMTNWIACERLCRGGCWIGIA